MKLSYTFLAIVLIAAAVFSYCVTADSKEDVAGTKKNDVLSKTDDSNKDGVNQTVEPVKNGKANNLGKSDSKMDGAARKGEVKENEGSDTESKKESKKGSLPPAREKCDSSSNRCTDDDKTLVACLRVPGNESPALSLLIQNMGKASLNIAISAPDLVELEKKQIELQENKDTEVKVSIKGVESGHLIILSAGHGKCTLNFRDQFVGMKKSGDPHDSSSFSNIFKLTLSKGFLFTCALIFLVISVFVSTKFGRKYFFSRKDPKYQKLDMELPISHDSKHESDENKGWDDNWGDDWDDEETPTTPSFPVTPSLSSKGMASRKFSKEGWKD
ncbi:hypothetical protein PHJA_000815800 [Phtheirospermum japonicum]|uniref:DUF7356 domain-containing protein n=1 Tax=Phtheirospermum japonicum TaxID=374723 RepID=A0A830BGL2_9LAMI|nr:hypothetical protein PHJA_000815800 [Phtheirospermum japonicum]